MSLPSVRGIALLLVAALLASACNALSEEAQELTAVFPRTVNLFVGSQVRVLGVEVGQITDIVPDGDHVRVSMTVTDEQSLPADARAHLIPSSLVGERFVQLEPAYTGGPQLADGAVIGPERTTVPTDVDEVLLSFEAFLDGLDPHTLAELVDTLAATLAGQGRGLNELIEGAAGTVRVLSDASDDLTAIVAELADLNEALATRDEQIGPVMEDFSTVLRTLAAEKDEVIDGLDNLQRLTVELRPLLDEHGDPLVGDLEVLTTTLSTVERNLERIGALARNSRRLFFGFGEAFEYPQARLPLQNQTEELETIIGNRLADRLAGVCERLGFPDCADPDFFTPHLQALRCRDEDPVCADERARLGSALAQAVAALPAEAQEQLEAEARERVEGRGEAEQDDRPDSPAPRSTPPPGPSPDAASEPRLPAPDPRLQPDDADALPTPLGGRR